MSALGRGDQAAIDHARQALATSHQLVLGTATDADLCRNIGRLEIALEQVLRVIDELGQGAS